MGAYMKKCEEVKGWMMGGHKGYALSKYVEGCK